MITIRPGMPTGRHQDDTGPASPELRDPFRRLLHEPGIGLQADMRGFHRFMPGPERDDRPVDTIFTGRQSR